jgi:hypothetical protein
MDRTNCRRPGFLSGADPAVLHHSVLYVRIST